MDENEQTSITPAGGQGEEVRDPTELLSDVTRVASDCKMIGRAIREEWDVPMDRRKGVINRMLRIVDKETVQIPTKDGTFDSEYHADGNSIAAAKVLHAMVGTNQADRHLADKNARLDSGKATENVGVVKLSVPPPRALDGPEGE